MDKIGEARTVVFERVSSLCRGERDYFDYTTHSVLMAAVDVYGAVRALAAHVGACGAYQSVHLNAPESGPACGDGWYCDEAKKYMKEAAR